MFARRKHFSLCNMKLFLGGVHVVLPSSPAVSAAITRHIAASAPGGRADKHRFPASQDVVQATGRPIMTSEPTVRLDIFH